MEKIGGIHNRGASTPYSIKEFRILFPGQSAAPRSAGRIARVQSSHQGLTMGYGKRHLEALSEFWVSRSRSLYLQLQLTDLVMLVPEIRISHLAMNGLLSGRLNLLLSRQPPLRQSPPFLRCDPPRRLTYRKLFLLALVSTRWHKATVLEADLCPVKRRFAGHRNSFVHGPYCRYDSHATEEHIPTRICPGNEGFSYYSGLNM